MFSGAPSSVAPPWADATAGAPSTTTAARAAATRLRMPPRVSKPRAMVLQAKGCVKSACTGGGFLAPAGAGGVALGRAEHDRLVLDAIAHLDDALRHASERSRAA